MCKIVQHDFVQVSLVRAAHSLISVLCLVGHCLLVFFIWPLYCLSFDVRLLVTRLVSSKSFMLSLYKIYNVIHFVGLFKDNHFAHKDYFVYTDLVIIGAVTWIFSNCCRVTSIPLTLPSLCGNTINQLSEHF
jgi:hypothetical protein